MGNKPAVLHLIRSLNPGGCEYMLLKTLPLLHKYDHYIFTLGSVGVLAKKFEENRINIINTHSLPYLVKKIKQIEPKIIITYLFHADLVGSLFIKPFTGYKTVPFLRSTYNSFRYLPAILFSWLVKPLINEYLANSEAVKKHYVSRLNIPSEKITVIPNGINLGNLKDVKFRRKTGNKIICVANFHPNKGHSLLLEAFEQVFKSHPNASLLLVGDGKEKTKLTEQIKNYRSRLKIRFMGYREDVFKLLDSADVFILPTSFEGMSNALLEAMACSLPVITSDIPENRELIKSGINGILYNPGDLGDLVNKVNYILDDIKLRNLIGKEARKTIAERFSMDKIVYQWDMYLAGKI